MEQRQSYKNDFNAEYNEYRDLHARIERITRRFTQLDSQLKQLSQGSEEYKVETQIAASALGDAVALPILVAALWGARRWALVCVGCAVGSPRLMDAPCACS